MATYLNIAVGILPAQLLEELGIGWGPVKVAANVLALIGAIAGGIVGLAKFIRWIRARLRLRDDAEKARIRRRQLFAEFVESRVRDLNRREEWSDYRFAELEAEVETVGDSRDRFEIGGLFGRQRGLRREKSLSKALMKSRERLILLRGDPGSGKSVALRFVSRKMALDAMDSNRSDSVIPIYVNLKDFSRGARQVDGRLIEDFVLESLRRRGDREVDSFLRDEFASGKAVGGWFFLFDSFDEIPEVLSSTEDDQVVQAYSQAISDFVEGMHSCRGVIASRHFRAPQQQGLPTFRIVPLSEERKLDLVAKADLRELEPQLVADLRALTPELAALSGNPLFLGLLVEYVKDKGGLPEGWHDVFESFVSRRLETDRERVMRLFGISADTLRKRSEEIAFTMTKTGGFGLSPAKGRLIKAYGEAGFTGEEELGEVLAALAWIKLGRTDDEVARPGEETFTFAHRRFQEYFATCVVLREPWRVEPNTLLTDARWRETAVTFFHAQPGEAGSLLAEAEAILAEAEPFQPIAGDYEWPPGVLHLLALLQSAFAGHAGSLPASLRKKIGSFLREAERRGTLTDRKWALEVAGTAPADELEGFLLKAFRGPSNWLREVAFRQVARLGRSPSEITLEIRRSLIEKVGNGELRREWPSMRAQIMRLGPPEPFMRTARLLRVIPAVDVAIFLIGYLVVVAVFRPSLMLAAAWAIIAVFGHLSIYPLADVIAKDGGGAIGVQSAKNARSAEATGSEVFIGLWAIGTRALVSLLPLAVAVMPDASFWEWLAVDNVPQGVADGGGALSLSLLWLLAASWAVSGLYMSLRESPPILAWPLLPFRFAHSFIGVFRGVDVKALVASLGIGLVFTGALGAISVLFGLLLRLLPEAVKIAITILGMALLLASVFVLMLDGARERIWDRKQRRQWLPRERRSMNPGELLDCLSSFKKTDNVNKVVREVRLRGLLEDTPGAAEVVRDLLSVVDPPDRSPRWRSETFEAWWRDGGARKLGRLAESSDGTPDELARLLEDLERGNEIPVA